MLSAKPWVTIKIILSRFPRARKTVLQLSEVPREEKEQGCQKEVEFLDLPFEARAGSFKIARDVTL